MPSPRPSRIHQTQTNPDVKTEKSAEEYDGRASFGETWRPSTSSSIFSEKSPADAHETEGTAEIALGVAVLPWWKEEEGDESLEGTDLPGT